MWDFNQVIFQGRITENAKLRETADGIKYCRFTVANNTPKKIMMVQYQNTLII